MLRVVDLDAGLREEASLQGARAAAAAPVEAPAAYVDQRIEPNASKIG